MIYATRLDQLLFHSWRLLWFYIRRCDLWLLLLFFKSICGIVFTCSYVSFFHRLNDLMWVLLCSLLFICIIIGSSDNKSSSRIASVGLIESSGVRFGILGLKMWGVLLLSLFVHLTCSCLWRDRLPGVISMLLQSCTIFASSFSRGCLQIAVPCLSVGLRWDHQRLLHLLLLWMLTLWYGKLLWDPWAR